MNNLNKSVLSWALTGLVVILAVFIIISINQKLNTATTTNTVSFSGRGKVIAKPDIATLEFSIITEAATSKQAQDDNSKKSKAVTDFLKKQGVNDKDVKTTYYNIYPKYSYPRPRPLYQSPPSSVGETQVMPLPPIPIDDTTPKIIGYQVTQGLQVKIRDFDKLSSVIDGLVVAGVNNVNNLGFSIDDPEKLKSEARAKAIADAKKKADELKGQIGIKLGKIVNFSEGFNGYPGPIMYEAQALGGKGGGGIGGPTLPPGETEITADVTLTYQIK